MMTPMTEETTIDDSNTTNKKFTFSPKKYAQDFKKNENDFRKKEAKKGGHVVWHVLNIVLYSYIMQQDNKILFKDFEQKHSVLSQSLFLSLNYFHWSTRTLLSVLLITSMFLKKERRQRVKKTFQRIGDAFKKEDSDKETKKGKVKGKSTK